MKSMIDDISRVIASPVSRRHAFKLVSGAVGGAVLASLGLGRAARAQSASGSHCAPDQIPCGNTCCHRRNQICCGAKCYNMDPQAGEYYICCRDTACTAGEHKCCIDQCCARSQRCCGRTCCPPHNDCCGRECCPAGYYCCRGKCYPSRPSGVSPCIQVGTHGFA